MKNFSLLMALLLVSGMVFSQRTLSISDYHEPDTKEKVNNHEIETLMSSFQLRRISGFGGPTMSFTTINGQFTSMMGGGGGLIINNLFLGGYGEATTHSINKNQSYIVNDVDFSHGGFWLGYEIAPHMLIHPVISTRIGWGSVNGQFSDGNNNTRYIGNSLFVLVPTVSAEINFTRYFKVNLGLEYRQVLGLSEFGNLRNENFSSLGLYTNFVFGWF